MEGKGWVEDGTSDGVVEVGGVGIEAERVGLERELDDHGFVGWGRPPSRSLWR